jgi:hypothetical protein
MHFLWRRLDEYDRGRVWKHYGWFSGLMSIGCCAGAASFGAWLGWLREYYASHWTAIDMKAGTARFFEAQTAYAHVS